MNAAAPPDQACPRCGARYPAGRLDLCPHCLLTEEDLPRRLDEGIELIAPLGQGGMGKVYRARDLRLGREVAVKLLAAPWLEDPGFRARLEREGRALARLDHPGIVTVYGFGEAEGQAYLVMALVPGQSLDKCLPLAPAAAIEIAAQLAAALGYAHGRGIVHRDVKPSNVLLTPEGRAMLMDFGIARRLQADAPAADPPDALTAPFLATGTPAYMAPEARGGAEADPRMDIYSLGALLYEMLIGRPPAGAFALPPPPLGPILARALAPDPADRYPDMAAFEADLRGAVVAPAGAPPAEPMPAPAEGPPAAALQPEERLWQAAVALAATVATAALLWAFLLSITPRVLAPGEAAPLTMLPPELLPDGRALSRARFETWPTLFAVVLSGLAAAAAGLLRRHWRHAGLLSSAPSSPIRASRAVLGLALAGAGLYLLRLASAPSPLASLIPILGGLLELAIVFFAWLALLEAWRVGRPLRREWPLWTGLALALVPPILELGGYLQRWQP